MIIANAIKISGPASRRTDADFRAFGNDEK
jgi:hypothetical protein